MKDSVAHAIVEAGNGEVEIYENYSGRGMFGKCTTAITCDQSQQVFALARAVRNATRDNDEKLVEELLDFSQSMKSDSLGLGMIYY